jgi:anaerobic magnesium-protoporphyrin IX monomethyl ester cyclase
MSEDKKALDFNLISLAKENVDIPDAPTEEVANDRHMEMMRVIEGYAKKTEQKNMTPLYVDYQTREAKIMFVLCPEWAPEFPPFNLARLSGICKSSGYESSILDLNIRAYNLHQEEWQPKKMIPFRLWDPSASWHWLGDTYMNDIHPHLEPLLEQGLQEIIDFNPTVVGFTQYYISEEPTKWMCRELKKRAPHIKIAMGGSNVQKDWFNVHPYYDYVCVGEGERAILEILEHAEANPEPLLEPMVIKQAEKERININNMPMPDYEGLDFSLYRVPNGVTSEFSRGCTAKCTFCEETHFWKYRQRRAVDVITEMEWLYYNKGTDIIWFIDSLVNGDPNELRAFARALKAKNLPIKWTGYARCDGRMDEEYFKDLADGGCIMLNYGCESGSQSVLDDMAKGVTIKEMEDNFKWGKKYNVAAATNWIVGFPTEQHTDFAKSMQFLWRNRNMNINNVGAGVGMAVGPETIVGQHPHKYNVGFHKYQNHWIRNDLSMGGTHVMHRVKLFHMFLDFMSSCVETPFGYPIRFNLAKEHYVITLDDETELNEVDYEEFDYNIIKPNINPFADALVNEIWPFLRMLWLTRGGFRAEIKFNPEIDLKEFGNQFGPGMFTGVYKFKISKQGLWSAHFSYNYDQSVDNIWDTRTEERKGPFFAQDYSRMQSNSAKRARKLAKPDWDLEEGRSGSDFTELLDEEAYLNQNIDLSFKYTYINSGTWSREGNQIDVPDVMGGGINNDNVALAAHELKDDDLIPIVQVQDATNI